MTETAVAEHQPSSLDVIGSKRPKDVLRLKYDVAEIMQTILKGPDNEHPNGIHYGPSFPGSKKNSLLLPGAHTLASTFGITPRYQIAEIPDGKGRRYQIKAEIYSRAGLFLGEGVGEASTEEEKFAWQAVICHEQFEQTDVLERRVKFQKEKNDAGYVTIEQIRTNPSDKSNTVLKIAKKRALVDGVILVLDCSDIFDQDFEELGDELGYERPKDATGKPREVKKKATPSVTFPYGKWKDRRIDDPEIPLKDVQWMADATANKIKAIEADPKHKEARFKEQKKLFLAALDAEIGHRQLHEADKQPSPKEESTFDDSTWADMVLVFEEQLPEAYKTAKTEFHVASAHDLPADKRAAFYGRINALAPKEK